ncbi:MAG: CRTAC1 family protein [Halobacteriales archaeon]
MTGSRIGIRITAIGILAIGVLALGGFVVADVLDGGQTVGQDTVQFEETATDCGLVYETTGNSDGSADGGTFVTDYDRDGWPDLLAVGGERPVLFENTGEGFDQSGALPDGEYPPIKSALFFDAEGDGFDDLILVPRSAEPIFLANRGGTFERTDVGFDTALKWGTGASAADFDGDGDLDVFITQNGDWRNQLPRRNASGEATDGFPNRLYENTEDGFERVEGPKVNGSKWSLATSAVDLTSDGRPDIHVANDYGYDALLVNQGNWTFERRQLPETNRHGMASVVRDVNGDGKLDLFVTNIEFENPSQVWGLNSGLEVRNRGNTLLINRGDGHFENRAGARGIRQGGWGWSGAIEDFDNDGTLDTIHATKTYLIREESGSFTTVETAPALWEGTTNGTFERRNATEAGLVTSNGRGLATFDYDRDGDRDVVVADTSNRFKLYENADDGGNWLQVQIDPGNGTAVGSVVRVETSDGDVITRVRSSRSNFFSQSSRTLQFGLGPQTIERLEVRRPDGTELVFEDVEADQRVRVSANGSLETVKPADGGC